MPQPSKEGGAPVVVGRWFCFSLSGGRAWALSRAWGTGARAGVRGGRELCLRAAPPNAPSAAPHRARIRRRPTPGRLTEAGRTRRRAVRHRKRGRGWRERATRQTCVSVADGGGSPRAWLGSPRTPCALGGAGTDRQVRGGEREGWRVAIAERVQLGHARQCDWGSVSRRSRQKKKNALTHSPPRWSCSLDARRCMHAPTVPTHPSKTSSASLSNRLY